MKNTWNQSEAVMAFIAWLTTREEPTVMSSSHTVYDAMERYKEFCQRHELPEVRDGYEKQIVREEMA